MSDIVDVKQEEINKARLRAALEAENARLRMQLAKDAADHNRCVEVMGRKIERLQAALQKCVIWIQDECQPEADFVGQGHNWNMNSNDRQRGCALLAAARRALERQDD